MSEATVTFEIPRALCGEDLSGAAVGVYGPDGAPVGTARITGSGQQGLRIAWTVDSAQLPAAGAALTLRAGPLSIPADALYKTGQRGSAMLTLEDAVNACSLFAEAAGVSERKAAEAAGRPKAAQDVTLQPVEGLEAADAQAAIEALHAAIASGGASGRDGATFTPAVTDGVLSWSNDGGLTNPAPVDITGPPGPPGGDGSDGAQGPPGRDGLTTSVNGVQQVDGNIALTAADIPIAAIAGLSAANVQEAIAANFRSVVDGKAALETAITGKGGTVSKAGAVATFQELAAGVGSIEGVGAIGTLPPQVSDLTCSNATENGVPRVRLSWVNPAAPYFAGVRIARNMGGAVSAAGGETVYTGTGQEALDETLSFDTHVFYRAFAYNSEGNFQTDITGAQADITLTSTVPLSGLQVGDKIKFGTHCGVQLSWVVVDKNHVGCPENSLSLMSEKAVYWGSFNSSGSQSAYYDVSTLRSDLNSDDVFLRDFTSLERAALLPVSLSIYHATTDANNEWTMQPSVEIQDRVYPPSILELTGGPIATRGYGAVLNYYEEGAQFAYFKEVDTTERDNRIKVDVYPEIVDAYARPDTEKTWHGAWLRSGVNFYNISNSRVAKVDEYPRLPVAAKGNYWSDYWAAPNQGNYVRTCCALSGTLHVLPTPDAEGYYTLSL